MRVPCFIFLYSVISAVQCQTWVSRACLVGHVEYYSKVMQEVFTQIERDIRWCNMKMENRSQVVNEALFRHQITGTVNYTNGFVVSVQKIDLSNIQSQVATSTVNATQQIVQTVRGLVNLRELNIGFDVIANLDGSGKHRFTGEYSHLLVVYETTLTWNRNVKELSVMGRLSSTSAGNNRHMAYWPANNITEILSRGFRPFDNADSFLRWSQDVIAPRMLTIAKQLEFPEVRFDGRC